MTIKAIAQEGEEGSLYAVERFARHVPFMRDVRIRTAIGFALLVAAAVISASYYYLEARQTAYLILASAFAWGLSVFVTHKYLHKYPQRYSAYVVAAHFKAACLMAVVLGLAALVFGAGLPGKALWTAFLGFCCGDFFVSMLRVRGLAPTAAPVPS